jgi:hypothetical protein
VNGMGVALAALGAVVAVIIVRDLLIWSLFWKRGWRVMAPVQKTASDTTNSVAPAAGENPVAGAAVPKPSMRGVAG